LSTVRWSSRSRDSSPCPLATENSWPIVALLAAAGGSVGLLNLAFAHVVRSGGETVGYTISVGMAFVLAAVVAARRRIGPAIMVAAVLGGDAAYLVCCLCVIDPRVYATPLMLLFPTLVGAWYLSARALAVHLAVVPVLVAVVQHVPGMPLALWVVQVLVSTTMLGGAAVMVFVLHSKVRELLAHHQGLAHRDPLTGLLNRRGLAVRSGQLRDHAVASSQQLAALVVDIDHFKRLNDDHGHSAGDEVLAVVAGVLEDSIGPDALAVRTGGEEFLVLLATASDQAVRTTADRIRRSVVEVTSVTCPQWPVTVSIGSAWVEPTSHEEGNEVLRDLVAKADSALYAAKHSGRNRVVHEGDPAWDEQPVI
jgi:diguanylate cyclase (GGDEF)-like protein